MRSTLLILAIISGVCSWETSAAQDDRRRFAAVDVYLDSPEAVAAWQFELSGSGVRIVGVENGESAAFGGTPYYDREVVELGTADRIIVADFSLEDSSALPAGRFRIATLHVIVTGAGVPEFDLQLVTAVTQDGRTIDASIGLDPPRGGEQ